MLLPLLGACATQYDVQRAQEGSQVLRTGIANVEASVTDVRREMAELRGTLETVQHRLERVAREHLTPQVQDRQDPQALRALEERIARLEQAERNRLAFPPQAPAATSSLPQSDEVPPDPDIPPVSAHEIERPPEMLREQQEYTLALELLRAQDYEQAVQQFRTFQRTYPASDMADDALYWIGEIYFMQRDYNRAILALNDVVLQYEKGDRRPDALVRQAEAFLEIGDRNSPRLILRKVMDDYPNSAAISKARSLLQSLEP